MIGRVQVVSVPVTDQAAARDFYEDVLGFRLVRDNPFGDGMRWIELAPPGGGPSITLVTWFDAAPPGSLQGIVLSSDDIDGDHDRLAARGVEFAGPVREEAWGRFATFRDPDGNGWVLQQDAG